MLPFTREQFLDAFEAYHRGTWPAAWVFYAGAVAILARMMVGRGARGGGLRGVFIALGLAWLWMGGVYHAVYFAPINPAARGFAALFVAQGLLLLREAWRADGREAGAGFELPDKPRRALAALLFSYALALYPALSAMLGHAYPRGPLLGLPCPTTIFTFGVLLEARDPRGRPYLRLLALPTLWSLIGSLAALRLGILEDAMLPASALLAWLGVSLVPQRLDRMQERGLAGRVNAEHDADGGGERERQRHRFG